MSRLYPVKYMLDSYSVDAYRDKITFCFYALIKNTKYVLVTRVNSVDSNNTLIWSLPSKNIKLQPISISNRNINKQIIIDSIHDLDKTLGILGLIPDMNINIYCCDNNIFVKVDITSCIEKIHNFGIRPDFNLITFIPIMPEYNKNVIDINNNSINVDKESLNIIIATNYSHQEL